MPSLARSEKSAVTPSPAFTELVGFFAAVATVVAFCCKRMGSLRAAAIAANLLFITYGALLGLMPVLVLHCVLLPLNLLRLGVRLQDRRDRVHHPRPASPVSGRSP
jgi:hypothetical protein